MPRNRDTGGDSTTWIDIIIGLVVYFSILGIYTLATWIIHRFYCSPYHPAGQRIIKRYRVPWFGLWLVFVGQAHAGEARNYVLYTETYGHKPAFTRDLSKQECEFVRKRMLEKQSTATGWYTIEDSDIKVAICFREADKAD